MRKVIGLFYRVRVLLILEDRVLSFTVTNLSNRVRVFVIDSNSALHQQKRTRALKSLELLASYVFCFLLTALLALGLGCSCAAGAAFGRPWRALSCLIHNDIELKFEKVVREQGPKPRSITRVSIVELAEASCSNNRSQKQSTVNQSTSKCRHHRC